MRPRRLPSILPFLSAALVAACFTVPCPGADKPSKTAVTQPRASANFEPAAVSRKEADLHVVYPGSAKNRSIGRGSAVVAIEVDADGKATDFLIVRHTDRIFGTALKEKVQTLTFTPAHLRRKPVPGRLEIRYDFEASDVPMNPMDASMARLNTTPTYKYLPISEKKLDRPLQAINTPAPVTPEGLVLPGPQMVWVNFYIDEEGCVHCPSVDDGEFPELAGAVIAAVKQWTFEPPTAKGKPALVYTERGFRVMPTAPDTTGSEQQN